MLARFSVNERTDLYPDDIALTRAYASVLTQELEVLCKQITIAKINGTPKLVDKKNSVILIEHHLDIIKNADWIVDLGPGAGAEGGKLIAQGTPENIAYKDDSFTGLYLKKDSGIIPKRGSAISTNLKRSASIKKPKETAFSFPDRTSEKDYTIKKRSSRFRRSRSYS